MTRRSKMRKAGWGSNKQPLYLSLIKMDIKNGRSKSCMKNSIHWFDRTTATLLISLSFLSPSFSLLLDPALPTSPPSPTSTPLPISPLSPASPQSSTSTPFPTSPQSPTSTQIPTFPPSLLLPPALPLFIPSSHPLSQAFLPLPFTINDNALYLLDNLYFLCWFLKK